MQTSQNLKSSARTLQQSFARGTTIIMIAMVLVKIFGAIFKIPLLSILGGEGYGYFTSAYNLYNPIYALSTVGLPLATSKLVSEKMTQNKLGDIGKIYKISSRIFIFTGLLGTVSMFVLAYPFAKFTHSPNVVYSIFALAPTVFFVCLMSIYKGYYQGMRYMVPTAVSEVVEAVGKIVFGLGFSYLAIHYTKQKLMRNDLIFGISVQNFSDKQSTVAAFGSAGAVLGITFAAFCGFVYIFLKHRRIKKKFVGDNFSSLKKTESDKKILKKLLKLAIPIGLGAIITNLSGVIDSLIIHNRLNFIMHSTPEILIDSFNGVIPTSNIQSGTVHIFLWGCFGTMSTITMLIPTFLQSISINALPTVTETIVKNNKAEMKKVIEQIIKLTTMIAIPCGIGLSVLSYPIFNLIYGNKPETFVASKIMVIAGISIIFVSISAPICSILQAAGRADIPLKILSIGLLMKSILNYVLVSIPEININGANISTLISYIFICIALLFFIIRVTGVMPNLFKTVFLPAFCSICCGISAIISYNFISIFINSRISTILAIIASVLTYSIVSFYTNCIDLHELRKIVLIKKE